MNPKINVAAVKTDAFAFNKFSWPLIWKAWETCKEGILPVKSDLLFQWLLHGYIASDPDTWGGRLITLELGCGFSTLNFGIASVRHSGFHIALEDSKEYAKICSIMLRDNKIPPMYCRIFPSPVVPLMAGESGVYIYDGCPHISPNLVYVDGPALTDEIKVTADHYLSPCLIDGRADTVQWHRDCGHSIIEVDKEIHLACKTDKDFDVYSKFTEVVKQSGVLDS